MSETAKRIKEGSTFVVTIKNEGEEDLDFLMRRPSVLDLVKAGVDPVFVSVNIKEEERQQRMEEWAEEMGEDLTKFFPIALGILDATMVEPKLYRGDGECPEDAVTEKDLGDTALVLGMFVLNQVKTSLGEVGIKASTFRVDTNGQDGGEGSDDVRDAADRHSEATAG